MRVADGCRVLILEPGGVRGGIYPHGEAACWQKEGRVELSLCEHF